MQRTIHVCLENKPGALMRALGILAATGSNIATLSVAQDPKQPGISRVTVVAELEPHLYKRVVAKINRQIEVSSAVDVTESEARGQAFANRSRFTTPRSLLSP